eukprot:SAG11_NODE_2085_length_3847_cov_2.866329_6_plen_81_part_00
MARTRISYTKAAKPSIFPVATPRRLSWIWKSTVYWLGYSVRGLPHQHVATFVAARRGAELTSLTPHTMQTCNGLKPWPSC